MMADFNLISLLELEYRELRSALTNGQRGDSQLVASMLNLRYQLSLENAGLNKPSEELQNIVSRIYATIEIEVMALPDEQVASVASDLRDLIRRKARETHLFR